MTVWERERKPTRLYSASEITTLQSLVDALNQGKVITNTEQTSDGYTLTFSDGSTVSIKNGKNGTDAPVIGVKADEDGIYYWTITTNGTTEWLPDATNKLKVTGTTPVMGVDSDGYWTVDTGEGAKRINGTDGKPVKAEGHCHITRVIYLHEVFIHLRGMNGITESYGNTTSGYLLYTTFGADRLNLHCL